MRLIDSHCHLNYAGLAERQDEVLANARTRGVAGFLNISTRQSEWDDVLRAAERNPDVWATVGVHPHEADAHPDLGCRRTSGSGVKSARDRHRRMRSRLSLRQERPRRLSATASRRISTRRARPACRLSSTRETLRTIPPRFSAGPCGKGASRAYSTASLAPQILPARHWISASTSRCPAS